MTQYQANELAHAIADDLNVQASRDPSGDGWLVTIDDHELRFLSEDESSVRISMDDEVIMIYTGQSYDRVKARIERSLAS